MNFREEKKTASLPDSERHRNVAVVLVIIAGMICVVALARWSDSRRPAPDPNLEEDKLYINGKTAKRVSLGFNGLVADWYWMRSLQYVGRKFINLGEQAQLENLGQLNLGLLAPLLDAATTLDPQFMEPYQYAAVVLPEVDVQEAIRIVQKGIEANPSAWKLYHHLGYIYWQQHDFKAAGEVYSKGATLPGAPRWMEAMKARMAVEGGSRNTAREIYTRMYDEAPDPVVKNMARRHLLGLDSLERTDVLSRVLSAYKARMGRCPASWREIDGVLRALHIGVDSSGAPLDPGGTPYLLVNNGCEVKLDPKSDVPSYK